MGIFRKYDIRGVYGKDLDENVMQKIGAGFSGVSSDSRLIIATDFRMSSPSLKNAFLNGVSGKHVIDIGCVPISIALHAAWKRKAALAYVTASHLGKENNGIKFYHSNAVGFSEDEILEIGSMCDGVCYVPADVEAVDTSEVVDDYVDFISSQLKLERPLSVVMDFGNAATCVGVKELFSAVGFEVDSIFDEPDGNFPNRSSDPISDDLATLRETASEYDFGIAFDGDGDRVVIVDDKRRKLTSEQMSFVILNELLAEKEGDVAANVECSMLIDEIARKFGRKVIRFVVGHPFLSKVMLEKKPAYGIEISGHGAIPSIAPFNDSVILGLYFGYALSKQRLRLSEIVDSMPRFFTVRKNYECADARKFAAVDELKKRFSKEYSDVDTMDGVRVNMKEGWVLTRASNTEAKIRVTAEAKSEEGASKLMERFGDALEELIF